MINLKNLTKIYRTDEIEHHDIGDAKQTQSDSVSRFLINCAIDYTVDPHNRRVLVNDVSDDKCQNDRDQNLPMQSELTHIFPVRRFDRDGVLMRASLLERLLSG